MAKVILTKARVIAIYQSAFGRAPSQAALNNWVGKPESDLEGNLILDKNAKGKYDQPWKSSPFKTKAEFDKNTADAAAKAAKDAADAAAKAAKDAADAKAAQDAKDAKDREDAAKNNATIVVVSHNDGTHINVPVPNEIAQDPIFQGLDPSNQALIAYNLQVAKTASDKGIKDFQDALVAAGQQADPYWKEKLGIMTDSLTQQLGNVDQSLAAQEADFMTRRDRIAQDLATGSTDITTEQQAELSMRKDVYDQNITNLREQMAATGLSSSTISNRAKEFAAKQNQGVVEGINRTADRQLRDLSLNASRTTQDIQAAKTEAERQALAQKTNLARNTEAYTGSTALSNLNLGNLITGNVTGQMPIDKQSDVLARAQALAQLATLTGKNVGDLVGTF